MVIVLCTQLFLIYFCIFIALKSPGCAKLCFSGWISGGGTEMQELLTLISERFVVEFHPLQIIIQDTILLCHNHDARKLSYL